MTNAFEVSKYLLMRGRELGINDISPLKLQKLLFLSYELNAKYNKKPMFEGDFEVWRHGPVLRAIYNKFKKYGSEIIDETFEDKINVSKKDKEIINEILNNYGFLSAWSLVDKTHDVKGIWYSKMKLGEDIINFDDIIKIYEK
ncbi:putative phage-associated protein [Staphylococcus hominis]